MAKKKKLPAAPTPPPELMDKKQRYINPLKQRSKTSVLYWKEKMLEKFSPEKTVLINMELLNGFHRFFLVKEKEGGFNYSKGFYIFDNEAKYYCFDSKLWCYDYHEKFALPIKRIVPVSDIQKTLQYSAISEVEYSTNPSTLEHFITSKIAEGIMKGAQIDEFFKQIRIFLLITMIVAIGHMILFMVKTGMLQQIRIPGVN